MKRKSVGADACQCCGSKKHTGLEGDRCNARFINRWPGKLAVRVAIRTERGTEIEVMREVPKELYDRAEALLIDLMKGF